MIYVDLGVRAVPDVRVDDSKEVLEVVFAILIPDAFLELRHVDEELEGLEVGSVCRVSNTRYQQVLPLSAD